MRLTYNFSVGKTGYQEETEFACALCDRRIAKKRFEEDGVCGKCRMLRQREHTEEMRADQRQ